ncbi:GNAT family N-acetyltransferase [Flindersiella endophytica]
MFWQQAHAWLEREPALHSVILGNVLSRRDARPPAGARATFAAVLEEAGGQVVGAAMHTPPFQVMMTAMPLPGIEALADALLKVCPDAPGVTGIFEYATEFARIWSERTGCGVEVTMRQRLHDVAEVIPARPVTGEPRLAGQHDRDLLVAWTEAFELEAESGLGVPSGTAGANVDARLLEDRAFVWEDGGRPVSYTGISHTIAGVTRVGPVYTPPELRGRGYASALVAAVTQGALDAGARRCALYTDLANPTSNKIYAAVGYRPVADLVIYKFTERSA